MLETEKTEIRKGIKEWCIHDLNSLAWVAQERGSWKQIIKFSGAHSPETMKHFPLFYKFVLDCQEKFHK